MISSNFTPIIGYLKAKIKLLTLLFIPVVILSLVLDSRRGLAANTYQVSPVLCICIKQTVLEAYRQSFQKIVARSRCMSVLNNKMGCLIVFFCTIRLSMGLTN